MRRFYDEYFYVPKQGKIRDKVFSARITFSIFIMLLLLFAAGYAAFAYFSNDTNISIDTISSARYELEYSVKKESDSPVTPVSDGSYLLASGTYTVTITGKDIADSAVTGFCIVDINGTRYHTAQIGTDINETTGERETLAFTLVVPPDIDAQVTFAAHWGTSTNYGYISGEAPEDTYIVNGETITAAERVDLFMHKSSDRVYIVQPGDTLSGIAAEFDTTVFKIIAYNNLKEAHIIHAGDEIRIPPKDYEIPDKVSTPETTNETNETTGVKTPDTTAETTAVTTTGTATETSETDPDTTSVETYEPETSDTDNSGAETDSMPDETGETESTTADNDKSTSDTTGNTT